MRTTDGTAGARYEKQTRRAWAPDAREGLLAAARVAAWDVLLRRLLSAARKPYGGRPLKQHALPPWAKAVLEAEKDVVAASPEYAVFVLPEVTAILTSDEPVEIPETHARPLHEALQRALGDVPNAADLVLRAFFDGRVAQAAREGAPAPKAAEITLLAAATGVEPLGEDNLDVVRKRWESRITRWKRSASPFIVGVDHEQFDAAAVLAKPGLASAVATAIGERQQGPVAPPIDEFFGAGVAAAIGAAIRARPLADGTPTTALRDLEAYLMGEGMPAALRGAVAPA